MELTVKIPEKLSFFMSESSRYKGAYGGRGAGKSWSVADALLIKAIETPYKPIRVLCARELQNSIKDSVHRLLSDRIEANGLQGAFTITDNQIKTPNGSLFIFKGLRTNISEIKSLEGIDICWVEEAEKVSQDSLNILSPTIRNEDSEIWFTWNTGTKSDPVYKMLVECPRPDAIVQKVNYYDNPWFPNVLKKEMEHDKATDEKKYNRIWLGEPAEGGLFFSNFDKELMEEQPFKIQPHIGERTLYGGFDFGWGSDGWASFGLVYLDGSGVPHRIMHWYRQNMTASKQADDLFEEIEGFYFTSGVFPKKIFYDYEMDVSGKLEDDEWAPIKYFQERWRKGRHNPGSWVRANKKRIPGWQCVTDYLGKNVDTLQPNMRFWPQYNKDWVESMESAEADENKPLDLAKSNRDHPCDDHRYCMVGIRGIQVEAEIGKQNQPRQAIRQQRDINKILDGINISNTGC